VATSPGRALLGALDGLGHGEEAAAASAIAVGVLEEEPEAPLERLIRRCHEALLQTRGVVMSLASFDGREGTLTWSGVGNVAGVLLRADASAVPEREELLLRGGVVGQRLPELRASVLAVVAGDVLVFATDGVRREFPDALSAGESPLPLAERILSRFARDLDDSLVLTVRFLGGRA
jgi:negative regulator of sigma-B (phosphoserine phosphatase)